MWQEHDRDRVIDCSWTWVREAISVSLLTLPANVISRAPPQLGWAVRTHRVVVGGWVGGEIADRPA